MTVRDIISAFGGSGRLADLLDCSPSAPSNWLANGRIPATRWLQLADVAKQVGLGRKITLTVIAAAHEPSRPRRRTRGTRFGRTPSTTT